MLDFKLHVFNTVAKRLNFTRAADELFISQPAVTKHIKALEERFKTTLFERSGNKKISLTAAGEILLQYTDQLSGIYRELEYDMNLLNKQQNGLLRIGASTTVAQYILPQVLAIFHKKFSSVQVQFITGNTEDIEQALLNKEIEVGIIEGLSRNPQIKYETYLNDELVLVCSGANKKIKQETIKPETLKNYPILLREPGSGTLDVLAKALKLHHIKLSDLQVEMQLGSTESIKSYLLHSDCLAFLSIHAILKELKSGAFKIIDIKGLNIERPFYFIQSYGPASSLSELFIRFARTHKPD